MADIADGEDISDHPVAVPVDLVDVRLNVVLYHGALKLCALVRVKAYIIGIVVEGERRHIKCSRRTVGGLAVKPYKGLVLVCRIR